jgi:hypothetical protein
MMMHSRRAVVALYQADRLDDVDCIVMDTYVDVIVKYQE